MHPREVLIFFFLIVAGRVDAGVAEISISGISPLLPLIYQPLPRLLGIFYCIAFRCCPSFTHLQYVMSIGSHLNIRIKIARLSSNSSVSIIWYRAIARWRARDKDITAPSCHFLFARFPKGPKGRSFIVLFALRYKIAPVASETGAI